MGHLSKALPYAVQRVCTLLSADGKAEKRLNPMQVDIVEGIKVFVSRSKALAVSALRRSLGAEKVLSNIDVEEIFGKFNLSGTALAQACSGQESHPAVALLQRSLQTA